MKKSMMALILAGTFMVSGCTSYAGIERAEDGDYYIATNKQIFIIFPGVTKCKAAENGDLTCKKVNVNNVK